MPACCTITRSTSYSRGVRPDLLAAKPDDAAHEVDREVAGLEQRPLALGLQSVAQRGADAGDELLHAERLGQVVVGAELQRLDDAGLVGTAGKDQHRHIVARGAPAAEQLLPGDVGQPEVEDHELGARRRAGCSASRPVPASSTS